MEPPYRGSSGTFDMLVDFQSDNRGISDDKPDCDAGQISGEEAAGVKQAV